MIWSFPGLRIGGFGGSGARNWRIPGGVGCHEHPQGWEQGEHHSTDPRTAENAPLYRGLRSGGPSLLGNRAKAPLKLLLPLAARRRALRPRAPAARRASVRAARSRKAARFPQSWGRCCDVRPAPNPVGVRAHAQTPLTPSAQTPIPPESSNSAPDPSKSPILGTPHFGQFVPEVTRREKKVQGVPRHLLS